MTVIVTVTGDGVTRTEITRAADPVRHGGLEVNRQRGGIVAMMTTALEIGSTGDGAVMTILTILVRPGAATRIGSVMMIRPEGASKKCIELWCRALVG